MKVNNLFDFNKNKKVSELGTHFIRSKRGQFYLIAAIIIIVIIIGFYGVKNVATSYNKPDRIYDLQKELSLEGVKVVDFGVYSQKNPAEMQSLLDGFTDKYATFAGQGKNIYFVFGNKQTILVKSYEQVVKGTVGVQIGDSTSVLQINGQGKSSQIYNVLNTDKVEINIGKQNYNFTLKDGENFYFVMLQENTGGTQIVSG